MKSRRELTQLAEQHGVRTTKRLFVDARDEPGQTHHPTTRFIDVPKPSSQLHDELVALGVLS